MLIRSMSETTGYVSLFIFGCGFISRFGAGVGSEKNILTNL